MQECIQLDVRLVLCRETLTALGPSFIKAGQVLASRPDIIREDYMNELCVLQVCQGCSKQLYSLRWPCLACMLQVAAVLVCI